MLPNKPILDIKSCWFGVKGVLIKDLATKDLLKGSFDNFRGS